MDKLPGVWGIDVGQCAFKAIRLETVEGKVTATAFDYIEHPKILSQPDADPEQLTREALDKFLERNNLKGDTVVLGIPGQSGLARFVKLPPVEEKKINDIVRFEAKQQIPFPLEEVIWDFQKVGSGVVSDGFAMETEIGLFAMKRDVINRHLQQFLDLKIEVNVVQMAPLALCNYVAFDLLGKRAEGSEPAAEGDGEKKPAAKEPAGKKRCVVALDIGTDNSNLVITDGERIIWQRPIPLGGNHFTRALTKEMKLTFAKAEHLKRNATKSPDLKKILAGLKPVLNEFVGEIQRSLGYFTNTHRDAQVDYLMGIGSAFRLPGLQKYLSEKLSLDVRRLQKLETLSGDAVLSVPAFSNNVVSFAMAYGLALQGMKRTRLQTNLLPHEIRMARQIRAKKPWAVAAAAALLLGISASTAGYALQYHAVAAESVIKAEEEGKSFADMVSKKDSEYKAKEAKIKEAEDAVKSIIAGQDERLNWLLLTQYVNECLPVPALRVEGKFQEFKDNKLTLIDYDGKKQEFTLDKATRVMDGLNNYVNPAQLTKGKEVAVVYQKDPKTRPYFEDTRAMDAYRAFWKRQTSSRSGAEASADEEGVADLIQVNLESVFALYTADLPSYYAGVSKKQGFKEGMADPNAKAPEGKGWVVEVRGYTYHRDRRTFIMNSIVENLATRAGKPAEGAAAPAGATPAAAEPAPAAAAATPNPAGEAGEKKDGADKPAEPKPFDKVIAGKISQVVLYEWNNDPNPIPGQFTLIGSSLLSNFVSRSGGGGGGGMGGGMGGGAEGGMGGKMGMMMGGMGGGMGGGGWQPLSGGGGGGGMGPMGPMAGGGQMSTGDDDRRGGLGRSRPTPTEGGAPPGMGAMARAMGGSKFGSRGGMTMPPGMGMAAGGAAAEAQSQSATPGRSEFVIFFIWQEPTPSDDKMGITDAPAEPAGGGVGVPPAAGAPAAAPPASAPAGGGGDGELKRGF